FQKSSLLNCGRTRKEKTTNTRGWDQREKQASRPFRGRLAKLPKTGRDPRTVKRSPPSRGRARPHPVSSGIRHPPRKRVDLEPVRRCRLMQTTESGHHGVFQHYKSG